MFVGHTAVALAARSRVPEASLGLFFASAFALDLVWPLFLILVIESAMFAVGIVLYLRRTRSAGRRGLLAFAIFVGVQAVLWASQPWSPPPSGPRVLAWAGLVMWLLPVWAWWVDRLRTGGGDALAARGVR